MGTISFKGELQSKSRKISVQLGIYLFKEDNMSIAYCPALDLSGYGNNDEEAKSSFAEVFRQYIEYCTNKKTLISDLQKRGWNIKSMKQRKIKGPEFESLMRTNKELKNIIEKKDYVKYSESVGIPVFS